MVPKSWSALDESDPISTYQDRISTSNASDNLELSITS